MSDKQAVLSILRDKILSGEFAAGERLVEIPTAEALGVSRTPVRIAFRALAQEGLLTKLPRRGYRVRDVSQQEMAGAVEVRGVLEGLAARLAAEKGLDETTLSALTECLNQGDDIFGEGYIDEASVQSYVELNHRFHSLIVEASGNLAIPGALQLNEHLPMASVNALVFNPDDADREFMRLHYAHMQHHAIVEALAQGQGARAEALMKEHAHAALNHFERYQSPTRMKVVRHER